MKDIQLEVADPVELSSLQRWLARVPDAEVKRVSQAPRAGEQGGWDVLLVLASGSSVLATAIRTLPDFLRSRRATLSIKVHVNNRQVELTATNVDDALSAVLKALDD